MKFEDFLSPRGSFIDHNVDLTKGTLAWGLLAKEQSKKDPNFIDATIGSAKGEDGKLLTLKTFKRELSHLSSDDTFGYANVRGQPSFVEAWKRDTISTFPKRYQKIADELSTLPVTSCGGLTGGLTIAGEMFLDEKSKLLVPDTRWSNIDNCFFSNQQVEEVKYRLLNKEGELDFSYMIEQLRIAEKSKHKIGLYLNFPHNPTGISPKMDHVKILIETLEDITSPVIIILDDAYEGYVYENNVINHSLYPYLIGLNDNVLVAKVDGISKRYTAYGIRLGMVTLGFGSEITEEQKHSYRESVAKTARTLTSSAPREPQEAFAHIFNDPRKLRKIKEEKMQILNLLKRRYVLLKEIIADKSHSFLTPVDFNSGFFGYWIVSNGNSPSKIGYELLKNGLGVVPDNTGIRLAFCSVKMKDIERASHLLYHVK